MNHAGKASRLCEPKQSKRTDLHTGQYNNLISTEFLISIYISAAASVDVTAKTNSLTDLADRKHAILSRAKISMRYQISNDRRGVRYRSFAQYPISKAWETKIGDVTKNTKHTRVATTLTKIDLN